MIYKDLDTIVNKRLRCKTQRKLPVPSVVAGYIINEDYEKLMKYFKTFCFVRPRQSPQCKRNYQFKRSENTLNYKLGKCGALSQLCYHMLKQYKKEVYFVAGNFDHAWVMVKQGTKLVSLDPSDGTVNKWHYITPDRRMRKVYMFSCTQAPSDITHMYELKK